jgi:hypothetical protein
MDKFFSVAHILILTMQQIKKIISWFWPLVVEKLESYWIIPIRTHLDHFRDNEFRENEFYGKWVSG